MDGLAISQSFRYNANIQYPLFAAGKHSNRVSKLPEVNLTFGSFFVFFMAIAGPQFNIPRR